MATNVPVTLDTPIVVKILFRGQTKKFKLPLRDLGAHVLPEKLRAILQVPAEQEVVFERYSDSAAAYVTLDSDKPQVYKTLFRAAKAKLKLRLKASIPGEELPPPPLASLIFQPASQHFSAPQTGRPLSSHQPVMPAISPIIARSPEVSPPTTQHEPVSPVSPPKPVDSDIPGEAPVPRSFTARQSFFNDLATASHNANLAFRPKPSTAYTTSWIVYCNNCNHPMEDAHFHCGVCDGGDYDLCLACVDSGVHCPGTGHWMVKRFVKNGCVVNSTTERIAPKVKPEHLKDIPGAFADEKQSVTFDEKLSITEEEEEPTRTCNCCVKVLPEHEFVTCVSCDDYDLCVACHMTNKHGHHPAHAFKAATSQTTLSPLAGFLCNSGRNVRHSAVCDGCDKSIYGVRHKCLNCPDWDYCSDCVKNAKFIHPLHRFVPVYEPLSEPLNTCNRHFGIYCDGPLCKDKENVSYIGGVRYKCAVCHDTDFCQNCEAHPSNRHNHTHPLIKFKTPVRSVCVTTVNDDKTGRSIARLGDRQPPRRSTATETIPVAPSTNAATQVQTIVDVKPSEEPQTKKEKIAIRDLLVEEPIQEKVIMPAEAVSPPARMSCLPIPKHQVEPKFEGLDAHFIKDTVVDGSEIYSGHQFMQEWTLRNPGPATWPAGCSVRHVGGDNMLNVDNNRPLSQFELAEASESNVMKRSVQAGEEISFQVLMKAPQREGTAISYWRLKTADGIPFGHRLWCDIQVVAPPISGPSGGMSGTSRADTNQPTLPSPLYKRILQARAEKMKAPHASNIQQLEQQAIEQVQRVRRAAVERLLENRRKEFEDTQTAALKHASVSEVEGSARLTAELFNHSQAAAQAPQSPELKLESSAMIFPQLDKESPSSSTHVSLTVQATSPISERSTIARTVTVASDDEFFEDAESVALHSDDGEGFMTDEEYDILDASDEELA